MTPDVTPGAWPLSAPATALLRSLRTSEAELLRLGIRHLVLVGAWRLEAGPLPPRRLGWQPKREVRLFPSTGSGPESLEWLDRALRRAAPRAPSSVAREVVGAALEADHRLAATAREVAVEQLVHARLVSEQPRPFGLGRRRALTPTGEAWKASIATAHGTWQRDLRAGGEAAHAAARAAGTAPGLVLAADAVLLADLDRELRRLRRPAESGGDSGAVGVGDGFGSDGGAGGVDVDLDGLLDGCGELLDGLKGLGNIDFGVSDGGGSGGDGGGGDGGGGGD